MVPTVETLIAHAPPRKAANAVTTKLTITPIQSDAPDATHNPCIIPANASPAAAGHAAMCLRMEVWQACEENYAREGGDDPATRFAAIFPGGNRAFTVARDGGRATGQIIVNASVDESPRLRSWLKSLSAGYLVSVAASDEYNYAVAVEKQFQGRPVHLAEVQAAIYTQLGVETTIFYNNREYKNCAIFAFMLTDAQHASVVANMDGEAVIELLGERTPIFDFYPKALRHKIYLMGGSDGLYSEPYVIQHFADLLCTSPETMVFTSVVDIASRHAGLHCLEVDYTADTYDQVCELTAQAIMRIQNPRKPRLPGTKLTVAASADEMQLLLNFGILKGIAAPEAIEEFGAAPLQIAPTRPRLSALLIQGPPRPPSAPAGLTAPARPPAAATSPSTAATRLPAAQPSQPAAPIGPAASSAMGSADTVALAASIGLNPSELQIQFQQFLTHHAEQLRLQQQERSRR
ncbi:hypothetical protein Ctob_016567 [Chrysochromulina tobinii]|uniref:Uncharacterized protein n=1 Tax=Chrysochromulina tobinii TaxID=1460289 RepID=A0A0M0LS69_9EUKA|nr:hypothetical protein Ctob_016567 [Chrysochromulina tobinii]|eukprot:KOO53573.1 hypothetical protein Ctob_016567 [Chrysochromulina sp. CCMP291]